MQLNEAQWSPIQLHTAQYSSMKLITIQCRSIYYRFSLIVHWFWGVFLSVWLVDWASTPAQSYQSSQFSPATTLPTTRGGCTTRRCPSAFRLSCAQIGDPISGTDHQRNRPTKTRWKVRKKMEKPLETTRKRERDPGRTAQEAWTELALSLFSFSSRFLSFSHLIIWFW